MVNVQPWPEQVPVDGLPPGADQEKLPSPPLAESVAGWLTLTDWTGGAQVGALAPTVKLVLPVQPGSRGGE